jgi:hypothetical protein
MPNPFTLIIAGVTGAGAGGDLLTLPAPSATTTPYVDLGSLTLTMSGDGGGGSMSFDVIEVKTQTPYLQWWRSGAVYDNARVQFFDSRYSATTPLFLGYITGIQAKLLENGVGTRATVSVSDADGWLQKTIIRNPKTAITAKSSMDSFTQGGAGSTDRDHINALLAKIHDQVNDATTRQILDTSVISGSTRAIFTGTAQTIGKQTFKATTLQSALDQIAEAAGGTADTQYRYWIDGSGRLNYGPVLASPAIATAPANITTDPAATRVGSIVDGNVGTTTILVRDLIVNLDHDSIVKGIFVQAADTVARYDSNQTYPTAPTNDPYFRTYTGTYSRNGAGQAARNGPLPHEIFSAPKVKKLSDRGTDIGSLARATMVSRGKPVRTVSFTVAGADIDQTSNPDWSYGYSQGYALSAGASLAARSGTTATITTNVDHPYRVGDSIRVALLSGPTGYTALNGNWTVTAVPSSTTFQYTTGTSGTITSGFATGPIYHLATAWLPGQYVRVTSSQLDLALVVLFIASVTMRFARGGGSYQVQYDIEADFRRRYLQGLKSLIGAD